MDRRQETESACAYGLHRTPRAHHTRRVLSPESDEEWEKAIHHLRRDGARPKQTPHGVIMNTSLAGFRSDFTIVYVPNGDFGVIKDQLYTNINLLRMGCSGRSALTLEEPSDTTKDRFISMYHLPDVSFGDGSTPAPTSNPHKSKQKPQRTPVNVLEVYKTLNPQHATPLSPGRVAGGAVVMVKTKDKPVFNKTVLELVKLIQAALVIFGMYDTRDGSIKPKMVDKDGKFVIDGLLCDVTVEGIQRWTSEIGEPCVGVEVSVAA
ncbi:Protein STB [Salix suchowensis]|nr:Protein STB [Salix suchowensis]